MLTYRLDPLSNPNSPIVCHRTTKLGAWLWEEGRKSLTVESVGLPARGGNVMGCLCLPSCPGEGNMLARGTLCTLSLSPLWAWGRFLTSIYERQSYIFFRFLPNLSPLFCILAGNFNWFASFSQSGLSHFPAQYNTCQFSLPIDNLCFSKIITWD